MAIFEGLSEKLGAIIKSLRSSGRITENDIKNISREIRLALLSADVNYKIVKDFVSVISEKALHKDVLESLTPGQQVIKIVHEELIALLGGKNEKLIVSSDIPNKYMLCGLQGSGKTTACGKLGNLLKKQNKRVMFVACDVYRPAAIDQLVILGKQLDIPVYYENDNKDVVKIAKNAIDQARKSMTDILLFDTAGRLHIDEELMNEIQALQKAINPNETLLVVDAMTGQDAVNIAEGFSSRLDLTGIILTKLDGDTRGGAALSIKTIVNKPIKFASVGERMNDLEPFYPDRMASRILGMGDVLSLIEKAQQSFDEKKAAELEKKMATASFTLQDYLEQLEQLKDMGNMQDLINMIPGGASLKNVKVDEKQIVRTKAVIQSMTVKERNNPKILDAKRRKRIAAGSGTTVADVNRVLKGFEDMKLMMKKMTDMKGKKFKGMNMPKGFSF
ncbi:MAG TPA: signal recognition particle protein [Clostridia bacterium]|jgi:signal recognition particle subunit SRP54|nr:signal recognition particle protein [Clostridiaceae bacterium]HOF25892.1 signal recognition particle protein [Clostridia bacterium]HOM33665.1 signal recognition particle protein [Clostridia bacterium]HOR88917.1 signal recognition particle protein [Clostridia bacterium]HOT71339.1 signal recognition particle protein [Clostridia bacterium]